MFMICGAIVKTCQKIQNVKVAWLFSCRQFVQTRKSHRKLGLFNLDLCRGFCKGASISLGIDLASAYLSLFHQEVCF